MLLLCLVDSRDATLTWNLIILTHFYKEVVKDSVSLLHPYYSFSPMNLGDQVHSANLRRLAPNVIMLNPPIELLPWGFVESIVSASSTVAVHPVAS